MGVTSEVCLSVLAVRKTSFISPRYRKSRGTSHNTTVSKAGDHGRGQTKDSLFNSWGVGVGATPFPGLLHFTLNKYLIMLSVKQGGIKYNFLSL